MNGPSDYEIRHSSGEGSTGIGIATAGLAVYFLVSILLRVLVSGTADMDETETLMYTQALRLGYGAQPPLYAWLQKLVFALLGTHIAALSFLKYTLLFSTYACLLRIAQKALRDQKAAVIGALSLFLVPQVLWESYRTLTNTVLATLLAAVTVLAVLGVREKPVTMRYLLLGAAAGLGMLSKYNYLIFLFSVVLAGASLTSFRKVFLSARSLLSIGTMAAITVPPYLWIAANLDRAAASSSKLQVLNQGNFIADRLTGLVSLVAAWIGYFWPALLVYGALYLFSKPVRDFSPDVEAHELIKRSLGAALIICAALVLFFNVTYFKERWMQPVLFILPVYFMHHLGSRLDPKRFRRLLLATAAPAILAMAAFPGSVFLSSETGRVTRLSPPYEALAGDIRDAAGFSSGTIISDDHRIGGNFRLHFSDSRVIVPGMMELPVPDREDILLVWKADRAGGPPAVLLDYVADVLGERPDLSVVGFVERSLLYWEEETMRLGYVIIEQPRDQRPRSKRKT